MLDQKENNSPSYQIILNYILRSGTIIFLIIYFFSFFGSAFRIAEIFCHFQVFYLGCAIFGFTLGIILKKRAYYFAHFVIIFYILNLILPFYFSHDLKRKDEPILKIYQSNVEAKNDKYNLVLDQIAQINPHIILLIETGRDWDKPTSILQEKYTYHYKSLIGPFGYIFYSRIPIINVSARSFDTGYDCLEILLSWEGKEIRFIAAHPPPPMNDEMLKIRNSHLLNYAKLIIDNKDTPAIICGDLNITPWSPCYKELIEKANLKSTRQGFGLLASWPNSFPYRIPIDHCLVTQQFGVHNTQLLPSVNSDHLPMLNEIYLKK